MKDAIVIIPARGGSKGVPRKNLVPIGPVSLIAHCVREVRAAKRVRHIYVSTDDAEIAHDARNYGSKVVSIIDRPAGISGDEASTESALRHAHAVLTDVKPDTICVLVQCTAPFVTGDDVDRCIEAVEAGADSAYCAARWHGFLREAGQQVVVRPRRQDQLERWHEAGSVYAFRWSAIPTMADRIHGRSVPVEIPRTRCFEIDDAADAAFADETIEAVRYYRAQNRRNTHLSKSVRIGGEDVGGAGGACYVVAEIGINHNGSLGIAKQLIDVAAKAGCNAVKFQTRTPELCVPRDQWDVMRDTPWGRIPYIEYRRRMEFTDEQMQELAAHCEGAMIDWFSSAWDAPSAERLGRYESCVAIKIPSAKLTDHDLLRAARATGKPVVLSTGMSDIYEIDKALAVLGKENLVLLQATSAYPVEPQDVHLACIKGFWQQYGIPTGYSGHERGLQITLAAVAMGACMVERHITLDRTSWGSDHAASLEPHGLETLVRDIRIIEQAMGEGPKRVRACELAAKAKLRGAA